MSELRRQAQLMLLFLGIACFLSACSAEPEQSEDQTDVAQVVEVETPVVSELPTKEPSAEIEESSSAEPTVVPDATTFMTEFTTSPLIVRSGSRTQTSGTVPHVQINVEPVSAVNEELFRLAFALPGVEERPTIVSLPGASGMWLSDDIPVVNPQAIVNGREFAHIHPDGSLHAPLPFERALEVAEKGWGERHPWADDRDGWEGFVMLYTPLSMEELDVIFQLIVESYNYVTGLDVQASDIQ